MQLSLVIRQDYVHIAYLRGSLNLRIIETREQCVQVDYMYWAKLLLQGGDDSDEDDDDDDDESFLYRIFWWHVKNNHV
jgi:hypothetical protein